MLLAHELFLPATGLPSRERLIDGVRTGPAKHRWAIEATFCQCGELGRDFAFAQECTELFIDGLNRMTGHGLHRFTSEDACNRLGAIGAREKLKECACYGVASRGHRGKKTKPQDRIKLRQEP